MVSCPVRQLIPRARILGGMLSSADTRTLGPQRPAWACALAISACIWGCSSALDGGDQQTLTRVDSPTPTVSSQPSANVDSIAATSTQLDSTVHTQTYEVVRSYPHDPAAFTQGLVFHDGYLYEGTGRRGESTLRKVELESGRVLESVDLLPMFFGEGIAILGQRVYQLTWQSGTGFVYDLESFGVVGQFRQFTEGWGLTHDGAQLILSDGSSRIYFLDPETVAVVRQIEVRDQGRSVAQINELEYIDGEIYANVWHSDDILRISPRTGEVLGRIDMSGIIDAALIHDPEAVLNGIAYDAASGRTFVTGKLWPRLFEVRFVGQR